MSTSRQAGIGGRRPGPRYGHAQSMFIKKTRDAIDAQGASFFHRRDWTRLTPNIGVNTCLNRNDLKMYAETFYVKPVVAWVPHLLLPNFSPTCPHCDRNDGIDFTNSEWARNPKVLHGVRSHRYLDTKRYKCTRCQGTFYGYNEQSLKLDSSRLMGLFNFRLSRGFAVDEELYSFIINHSHDTTASIYRKLALSTTDYYLDCAMYYYRAVEAGKVRVRNENVVHGSTGQRTLDSYLTGDTNPSPAAKQRKLLTSELARLRREAAHRELILEGDIEFVDVFKRKSDRNNINLPFKGIGKKKLLTMIEYGILTAKELLDYEGGIPAIKMQWKDIVKGYYASVQEEYDTLLTRIATVETEVDLCTLAIDIEAEEANGGTIDDPVDNQPPDDDAPVAPPKPPPFSSLTDPEQFNARCVSKDTIDRITASDFENRKKVQDAKMRNIPASILKMDWSYKLAPKVKVYTGRGRPFSPFRSMLTIQNGNSQCVFWKMYPGTESYKRIEDDLRRLKQRFDLLGCTVHVIYVDNCCHVRDILQKTFPDALIKLDVYHWLARWDNVLLDTNSPEASVFRNLMRRALFVVESDEFERVKSLLEKKYGRPPSTAEIMKQAKATIPGSQILKERVDAVLRYVHFNDMMLDLESLTVSTTNDDLPTETSRKPKRKRFFKPMTADVRKDIKNQLSHVIKDCLSDPPKSLVRINRVNPATGKAFTARSTGTNEVDNRALNALLSQPSVGIARALRCICDHYEESNERKMVRRMGHREPITTRSEKLYLLNSVAKSCGFDNDELPIDEVSAPPELPLQEYLGFHYRLPPQFEEEEAAVIDDEENQEEAAGDTDFAQFLEGIDFEDDDIPVDPSAFDGTTDNMDGVEPIPVELEATPLPAIEEQLIAETIPLVQPTVTLVEKTETTMETFSRLTEGQPWVPFAHPSANDKTAVDEAEHELFEKLRGKFKRFSAYPYSAGGYGRFSDAWDVEVAIRYKKHIEALDNGEPPNTVLIRRKTYKHLQDHYDNLLQHLRQATLVKDKDSIRDQLDETMTETRRRMPSTQATENAERLSYNQELGLPPFGAPTALNTEIAANAVRYTMDRNPLAPYTLTQATTNAGLPRNMNPVANQNFRSKKYCVSCGFSKSEHMRNSETFGQLCKNNCAFTHCSKCWERLSFHGDQKAIGPYCVNLAHTRSMYTDWYKVLPNNNNNNESKEDDAINVI